MGRFTDEQSGFHVKKRVMLFVADNKFPLGILGKNNGRRVIQKCLQKGLTFLEFSGGHPSGGPGFGSVAADAVEKPALGIVGIGPDADSGHTGFGDRGVVAGPGVATTATHAPALAAVQ